MLFVEHLHADVVVESTLSHFNGITQDSMDDSFHGVQGGFFISEEYQYGEVFSIEGSSPKDTSTQGTI